MDAERGGGLVHDLAHDVPLMVALVQAATSLPVFLVGLPAGAIVDIVDRRRLLLWTQGWMLVIAGLLV